MLRPLLRRQQQVQGPGRFRLVLVELGAVVEGALAEILGAGMVEAGILALAAMAPQEAQGLSQLLPLLQTGFDRTGFDRTGLDRTGLGRIGPACRIGPAARIGLVCRSDPVHRPERSDQLNRKCKIILDLQKNPRKWSIFTRIPRLVLLRRNRRERR